MDDLVAEFITETNESLEELDLDLVNLEQNPNDIELLKKIFRLMHTIKGTCGFLALPRLEKVAHHAENVLGRFRDGDLKVTPDYVTVIFESIDVIKSIVATIQETGSEPDDDNAALIEKLDIIYEGREEGAEAKPPPTAEEEMQALEDAFANAEVLMPTDDDTPAEEEKEEESSSETVAAVVTAAAPPPPPPKAAPKEAPVLAQTLRVNVDVLEDLMTLVSELVLTRNQLLQILRMQTDSDFSVPLQRLCHVVSELQEGVMKTRMQPIGNAWSKLPRIIRDLSMELDKKIDLEMVGQETELDRQVLELIKDPLTHMVRNSGDHGIESPADRVAAGKPETGKITLKAFHEGGHIIIEISDDGKGLSSDKIRAKILENGLATENELADMTTQQIHQFIFNAGLSTAEKVTAVSGRGVGMDVVRTNIEKIGGYIDLKSIEGQGSTFTIKIPLTLAIVSALIVEAAGERFAIPQLAVRELVMASDTGANAIEVLNGAPVFRLREKLLPLIRLSEMLKIDKPCPSESPLPEETSSEDGSQDTATESLAESTAEDQGEGKNESQRLSTHQYIVVTQVGSYDLGIIVDRVFDTEEIVVKPVAKILRDIEMFSGNTILGDGSVIMILDPNGISKATGDVEVVDQKQSDEALSADVVTAHSKKPTSLLLFQAGDGAPKTVPLSLVARLENIKLENIEYSSGQMMVQYRDQLMPLIPLDASTSLDPETNRDKPVLVFTDKDRSMGLIVDEIIDITEEAIDIQLDGKQDGLLGSAIINGKATDVINVAHYFHDVNPNWFKDHSDEPYVSETEGGNKAPKRSVLLIDDSPFFRNMLTPLLSMAGYNVTSLESARDALKMCNDGAKFDIIVSDIEMPDMDGFEFAEKVKASDSKWLNTPLVALSSHATPQDIDRGLEVGFNKYVAKFDRDVLLNTLSETLSDKIGEVA